MIIGTRTTRRWVRVATLLKIHVPCGIQLSLDKADEDDEFYSQKMPAVVGRPSNRLALDDERATELVVFGSGGATIEVSPGEYLRLRGAEETLRAIRVDFYMPCECICCLLTIFCIQDADLVLCPSCRVISPMVRVFKSCNGGVGLGFTMRELANYLKEEKLSNGRMHK
jgi:hypothetical protein